MENGAKVTNTYNDKKLMTTTTDERGAKATFTYNDDGHPITKTVEGLGVSTYDYELGKLTSEIDFLGNKIVYEYDGTGKLIKKIDAKEKYQDMNTIKKTALYQ